MIVSSLQSICLVISRSIFLKISYVRILNSPSYKNKTIIYYSIYNDLANRGLDYASSQVIALANNAQYTVTKNGILFPRDVRPTWGETTAPVMDIYINDIQVLWFHTPAPSGGLVTFSGLPVNIGDVIKVTFQGISSFYSNANPTYLIIPYK